jgi:hypothetical protein
VVLLSEKQQKLLTKKEKAGTVKAKTTWKHKQAMMKKENADDKPEADL